MFVTGGCAVALLVLALMVYCWCRRRARAAAWAAEEDSKREQLLFGVLRASGDSDDHPTPSPMFVRSPRDSPAPTNGKFGRVAGGWLDAGRSTPVGWRMVWNDSPRSTKVLTAADYRKYERVRVLGRGAHGTAVLLRHRSSSDAVVSKELDLSRLTPHDLQAIENEVRILSSLSHENIIAYYASFPLADEPLLCVIMEYAEGGNLADVIAAHGRRSEPFPHHLVLRWFAQLASALRHLHDNRVLHRDLKAQNVFLTLDQRVKLGDFGVSRQMSTATATLHTVVGTPVYMSPEVMRSESYGEPADMWALGVILYELIALRRPFDGVHLAALILLVTTSRADAEPLAQSGFPPALWELATSDGLLHADPSKRLTLPQLQTRVQQLRRHDEADSRVQRWSVPSTTVDGGSSSGEADPKPTGSASSSPRASVSSGDGSVSSGRDTTCRTGEGATEGATARTLGCGVPGTLHMVTQSEAVLSIQPDRLLESSHPAPPLLAPPMLASLPVASVGVDPIGMSTIIGPEMPENDAIGGKLMLRPTELSCDDTWCALPEEESPHAELLQQKFGQLVPSAALKLHEIIDVGGFSKVYRAALREEVGGVSHDRVVAAKVVQLVPNDEKAVKMFIKEVSVLRRLCHPNLLELIGVSAGKETVTMLTALMPRGSLYSFLRNTCRGRPPPLKLSLRLLIETACGMSYLHTCSPRVVHRDLKSSNILLSADYSVKVLTVRRACSAGGSPPLSFRCLGIPASAPPLPTALC